MTPATPGSLRQSAAARQGVVPAGVDFFYASYNSVAVRNVDHPLVILGLWQAHDFFCVRFDIV